MKAFILLFLCTIYSASCFVITIPSEDMDNEVNHKNTLDSVGPMDYRRNFPDDEVEVFSPSEINYQQPTFIGNDMITPEVKKPAMFDSEDSGNIYDDWTILKPNFQDEPTFGLKFSTDNERNYDDLFHRTSISNTPTFYGKLPQEYDAPSNENIGDMFRETVLVNGMPTELSQERTEELEKLYQEAYAYQWLMRFCITHPRCNTETLLELILSSPKNLNQDSEQQYFARK